MCRVRRYCHSLRRCGSASPISLSRPRGTPIDTVKVTLLTMAAGVTDEAGIDAVRIRVEADGTRVVPVIKDPPLRQMIVPTTLSGAEFSNLGGCRPLREVKDLYTGRLIGGQVVILDPAATIYPRWSLAFNGHPRGRPCGGDYLFAKATTVYRRYLHSCTTTAVQIVAS